MEDNATEALFRSAFASSALITAQEAARLLGLDPKTLGNLVAKGSVRAVLVGKVKRFTEADLRAFLATNAYEPPFRSTQPQGFTEMLRSKRQGRRGR